MIQGPVKLNVQVMQGAEPLIGPGKALVLEAIARTGSISAAGREIGMSYRRIWLLVASLNSGFREPAVAARVGGGRQAGAQLTDFGRRLLETYRQVEQRMMAASAGPDLDWLIAARAEPDAPLPSDAPATP